jgi:hypothetical protein
MKRVGQGDPGRFAALPVKINQSALIITNVLVLLLPPASIAEAFCLGWELHQGGGEECLWYEYGVHSRPETMDWSCNQGR